MQQHEIKRGDAVRVAGYAGVAFTFVGPETTTGPNEWEAECASCAGTGTDDSLDEIYEGNCLECNGEGTVTIIDEEPELVETGRAVVVMVGDDRRHVVDFDDMTALAESEYCGLCGQLGCEHGDAS